MTDNRAQLLEDIAQAVQRLVDSNESNSLTKHMNGTQLLNWDAIIGRLSHLKDKQEDIMEHYCIECKKDFKGDICPSCRRSVKFSPSSMFLALVK